MPKQKKKTELLQSNIQGLIEYDIAFNIIATFMLKVPYKLRYKETLSLL